MRHRTVLLLLAVTGALATGWVARAQDASVPAAEPKLSDYALVYERNIFLATRSQARPVPTSRPAPRPIDPRTLWVLRGTLLSDELPLAVWEHLPTGELVTTAPGEAVYDTTVLGVVVAGVTVDAGDGSSRTIDLGQTLAGENIATDLPTPAPAAPASTPTGGDEGSLLERLRQKRLREMGEQ